MPRVQSQRQERIQILNYLFSKPQRYLAPTPALLFSAASRPAVVACEPLGVEGVEPQDAVRPPQPLSWGAQRGRETQEQVPRVHLIIFQMAVRCCCDLNSVRSVGDL